MTSVKNPATILLVDDDEVLRRFVQRILEQQGFHIIAASDGAEALQVASAYAAPIDLLLTDVIMPKVNGLVLARRLLHERPGIGVLYMSGHVEKSILLAKASRIDRTSKAFNCRRADRGRASNAGVQRAAMKPRRKHRTAVLAARLVYRYLWL